MSYLPGEVKENLTSLSTSLSSLAGLLGPLQEQGAMSQLSSQAMLRDSIQVNTALAYSLNSLYYVLLKLQGKNVSGHPITKEIEQVRALSEKVQHALKSVS